jgi:hypothetical protein
VLEDGHYRYFNCITEHDYCCLDYGSGFILNRDFKENKVKQLLNIPDERNVVVLFSFGYPAKKTKLKERSPSRK